MVRTVASDSFKPLSCNKCKSSKETIANDSPAIDLDGRDPDFAASLRSIGPVNPSPTFSNSSTFNLPGSKQIVFPHASNPALLVVTARQRLTEAAEREAEYFGYANHPGRSFLDALTIQQVLTMRDRQGMRRGDIERFLGLKKGVLERLGKDEIVSRIT